MLDPLKEEDKEILKKAIEIANRKPKSRNREAIFLRNFTLALMKQYKYHQKIESNIKINRFNLPHFNLGKERKNVNIQLSKFKNQPRIVIKPAPKPVLLPVKDTAPKPIELVPEIPAPL